MIPAAQGLRRSVDYCAVFVLVHHRHIRRYIRLLVRENHSIRGRYPAFHVYRYFLRAGPFQARHQFAGRFDGMIPAAQGLRRSVDYFAIVVLVHYRHIRLHIRRLVRKDYRVRGCYPAFHVHRYFLRAGPFQARYQSAAWYNNMISAAQGLRLLVDHFAIVVLIHHRHVHRRIQGRIRGHHLRRYI